MTEVKTRKVKYGNTERRSFAKVDEVIDMPNLIEVQKKSYSDFLEHGIGEVFRDFSPITDFSGRIELHFLDYRIEDASKYTEKECKDRDATYATPLKVKVRLVYKETGQMTEQEVFMGDMPKMTPNGSFIINGAERVIVSQLVRSPGVYFSDETKDQKTGKVYFTAQSIPSRGAWLEYEMEPAGTLAVHVDRQRKVPVTTLIRALSAVTTKDFGSDESICKIFHDEEIIKNTCEKDAAKDDESGLEELNKRLRPGEIFNPDSVAGYIHSLFFDRRKYDLSRVGRYKLNKKLCLASRITGLVAADDVVDKDGIVYVVAGNVIDEETAFRIRNAGINEVAVRVEDREKPFWVMGNGHVDLDGYIDVDPRSIGITESVSFSVLTELMNKASDRAELAELCRDNADRLAEKHITVDDILSTVNYIIGLHYGIGYTDNIDHLGNRRVRSVGELLQNQFRIGIARLERVVRERMQIQSDAELTPQTLINIRPVTAALKEFFGSSQLSQFMDETNPISELTHKRKLSALGPGGLNRDRATFDVRDVHYSHYGRMCPIETPEGQNIGLISSLTSYAKINEYGFIEAPYRKVAKFYDESGNVVGGKVTDEVEYLSADREDRYIIAQAKEPLGEDGWFEKKRVLARYREDIKEFDREEIDYVDVSPRQLVSVATSLIPFLENDDTNRALMGSNMQRQAVPLLRPEAPMIGTGIEHKIAYDSGVMVIARADGEVCYVDAETVKVREEDGTVATYLLKKFQGSNQGTCINQKPIVAKGQKIKAGDVLADGHSTQNGELALGRNILVGFMSWEGYNYEDAILISERIVKDDVFTSIHIAEYEMEARDTKLGEEEITRDIPNVGEDALKNLDENGIVYVGAEVTSGDILVGKVTPKGEADLTPEERLMRAIFGEKSHEVRDTSLKVPHGEGGIVVDVKVFTRANKDEMSPGVNKVVSVYIAQKRKIGVGDKMAGRHGNKGVISRVLPEEDMPFMADGTRLQIVLNPLGVPSRMNIGQVLEVHLGLVAKALGWKVATPVFDSASEKDIEKLLKDNGFVNPDGEVDGKIQMYDGRTGEPFENRTTVGYMYMLKLIHLVDDKMHARSIGPYSLVTQQPLGGKAQFGGQRFGEMEVWALYAYGAANILQEIMTVKSDDVVGRVKTYESIVKGVNVSEPGVPESFKVLIKELQALGLDIKVLNDENKEISIKDITEDEADTYEAPTKKTKHFENGKLVLEEEIDLDAFDDIKLDDDEDKEETQEDSLARLFGDDDDVPEIDDIVGDDEDFDDLDDVDDMGVDLSSDRLLDDEDLDEKED